MVWVFTCFQVKIYIGNTGWIVAYCHSSPSSPLAVPQIVTDASSRCCDWSNCNHFCHLRVILWKCHFICLVTLPLVPCSSRPVPDANSSLFYNPDGCSGLLLPRSTSLFGVLCTLMVLQISFFFCSLCSTQASPCWAHCVNPIRYCQLPCPRNDQQKLPFITTHFGSSLQQTFYFPSVLSLIFDWIFTDYVSSLAVSVVCWCIAIRVSKVSFGFPHVNCPWLDFSGIIIFIVSINPYFGFLNILRVFMWGEIWVYVMMTHGIWSKSCWRSIRRRDWEWDALNGFLLPKHRRRTSPAIRKLTRKHSGKRGLQLLLLLCQYWNEFKSQDILKYVLTYNFFAYLERFSLCAIEQCHYFQKIRLMTEGALSDLEVHCYYTSDRKMGKSWIGSPSRSDNHQTSNSLPSFFRITHCECYEQAACSWEWWWHTLHGSCRGLSHQRDWWDTSRWPPGGRTQPWTGSKVWPFQSIPGISSHSPSQFWAQSLFNETLKWWLELEDEKIRGPLVPMDLEESNGTGPISLGYLTITIMVEW